MSVRMIENIVKKNKEKRNIMRRKGGDDIGGKGE